MTSLPLNLTSFRVSVNKLRVLAYAKCHPQHIRSRSTALGLQICVNETQPGYVPKESNLEIEGTRIRIPDMARTELMSLASISNYVSSELIIV